MQGFMGAFVALALTVGGAVSPARATAQDDDWEFGEDAAQQLTVAAVRYDDGRAIFVQCRSEELKVALIGFPNTTETSRRLEATRADGVSTLQTWQVVQGQALSSALPARDARFLRAGGALQLHSPAGAAAPFRATLELPLQHASLDRVLTACGYPVEDDRDRLPTADDTMRLLTRVADGAMGGSPGRSMEISCIIRAGAYSDCRVDHRLKDQSGDGQGDVRDWNRARVHQDDAAANEGRVVYIFVPLLQVVRR